MREAIDEIESALRNLRKPSPWDARTKASDDFLDPLFASYFDKLGLPNLMAKSSYHELVEHVPAGAIDPEIGEKLDAIARVAEGAAWISQPMGSRVDLSDEEAVSAVLDDEGS